MAKALRAPGLSREIKGLTEWVLLVENREAGAIWAFARSRAITLVHLAARDSLIGIFTIAGRRRFRIVPDR